MKKTPMDVSGAMSQMPQTRKFRKNLASNLPVKRQGTANPVTRRRIIQSQNAPQEATAVTDENFAEMWEKQCDIRELRQENKKLMIANNRYKDEIRELRTQKEQAKSIANSNADRRISAIKERSQDKVNSIRLSSAFQLGYALTSAVSKPGMNTLKLPFRLVKITFEGFIRKIMS